MEDKKIVRKQIGEFIKTYRKNHDMTREEFAEACLLSSNFIGEVERGEKCPSIHSFFKLAAGLEIEPVSLFKEFSDQVFPVIEENIKANCSKNR